MTNQAAHILVDTQHTPALRSSWSGALKQKGAKLWSLRGAFTKAAIGAGTSLAFKSAAIGAASSAGAGVAAAAFAGGAAVTTYTALRDYRAHLKAQEESRGFWGVLKGFFGFLFENKRKYGFELLKNSTFGAVGAGIVEFGGDLLDVFDNKAVASPDISAEPSINSPDSNDPVMEIIAESEERVAEQIAEATAAESDAVSDVVEIEAQPEFDVQAYLAGLDTSEWSAQALADLEYAQNGQSWAIQNIAHYALNTDDVPFDLDMARTLAQEAAYEGNTLAQQFLIDIEKVSVPEGVAEIAEPEEAEIEQHTDTVIEQDTALPQDIIVDDSLEVPLEDKTKETADTLAPEAQDVDVEFAFGEYLEGLDTSEWSAQALADLEYAQNGQSWAIQNIAHYALNTDDVPFDLDMARTLAQQAADQGNALAQQFLIDIENVVQTPEVSEDDVKAALPAENSDGAAAGSAAQICEVFNTSTQEEGPSFSVTCADAQGFVKPGENLKVQLPNGESLDFKNAFAHDKSVADFMNSHVIKVLQYDPGVSQMIFE